MSLYQYLVPQPVEPKEDGTISELDAYTEDEVIDLSHDEDGEVLAHEWDEITTALHAHDDRE